VLGHVYSNNCLTALRSGPLIFPVSYNASGQVVQCKRLNGVVCGFKWNTLGQLVSVTTNGILAESYAYDPLGRRISTTAGGATIWHAYDGDRCSADTDASGNILRSYTWGLGIDNLLAITVYSAGATNSYYAVKDHLGSVHALVDESGAFAESYSYDAWGTVVIRNSAGTVVQASPLGNRFLFQGREFSSATQFYNFRTRWYAPELGRWLSPDPIGLEGGLNLYEFCANNPVNCIDPYGLDSVLGSALGGFAGDLYENGGMNALKGLYGVLRSPWDMLKGAYHGAAGLGSYIGKMSVDPSCTWGDTLDALGNLPSTLPAALDDWMNNPEAIGSTFGQVGLGLGAAKALSSLRGAKVGVQANRAAGLAAEARTASDLIAEGNTILGSHVGARTSEGLRVIDHLIQTPNGQILAIEIKSGGAVRNARQMLKDSLMATEGAVITGKNAPVALRGQQIVISTIERRY